MEAEAEEANAELQGAKMAMLLKNERLQKCFVFLYYFSSVTGTSQHLSFSFSVS